MRIGPRYAYILIVYVIGIVVFTLFRVLNTLVYCMGAEVWPDFEGQYAYALVMGWRFDTVVSCYLLTVPLLMAIVGELAHIRARGYYMTMHILTVTLYTLAFFACAVDVPFFSYFFTRLNAVAMNEAESFGLIVRMILREPKYLLGLAAFVALAVGYALLMRRVFFSVFRDRIGEKKPGRHYSRPPFMRMGWATVVAVVLVFGTFVGMRGRLGTKSPLRVGTASYCGNAFLNQLGLNPVFTLVKSVEAMNKSAKHPLALMDSEEARKVYEADRATPIDSALAEEAVALPEGMNVVVVIMESMTVEKTGLLRSRRVAGGAEGETLTPCLDSLMRGGLLFTQCYSAGIHTYNGVYSTLYSHPGIPARHTMRHTIIPMMSGLPQQMQAQGYQTTFMLPHEEDYDNMRDFLHANAFDSVVGQHSFPEGESVGPWGLPDHRLLEHAVKHCSAVAAGGRPFFTTVMTCSDHVPYILPEGIDFKPRSKAIEEKMVEYADWSLGHFMRLASREVWFDNTVFVFIADHGAAGESLYDVALSYHHVPMLFYAPKYIKPWQCDRLALQIDLYPTLMGMLPYRYENKTFGFDLLRQRRGLAYFSSDDKISVMDTEWLYICQLAENEERLYHWSDNMAGNQIEAHRAQADAMRHYGFGLVQHSYDMIENGGSR